MRVGKGNIVLTAKDRKALESWVDRPGVPLRLIIRAWIVLLSAAGHATSNIASRLGVSNSTVHHWRGRFLKGGLAEISDEKKITRPRHDDEEIKKIIEATKQMMPSRARRWSIRNMAQFTGVSRSTIQRIWKAHGLRPFRAEEFKFEHDPDFFQKCRDVAGLFIESETVFAVALFVDETAAPAEPYAARPAEAELMIQVLKKASHRRKQSRPGKPDMLEFVKRVHSHTPSEAFVHLIVPRQSMTLRAHVFRWLKRHPRFQTHVIPKDFSARKMLSDWFAKTAGAAETGRRFPNFADLKRAMEEFLQEKPGMLLKLKNGSLSRPFFWNRPDRNYFADERQLELDLTSA